ncbi:hypothetical protein, partial [Paraburkholderia sp. Ac-20336]|uniref:hypothetical protein n=1 Tax=Paraburkholderia sp. Ac-20336 TaxID=2703886 RepID=UPI0019818DC8
RWLAVRGSLGVTVDAPSGSSVDALTAACASAGLGESAAGDAAASSCDGGNEAAAADGAAPVTGVVDGAGEPGTGEEAPVVPAFSG